MDLINDTPPKSDYFNKPKNEYGGDSFDGGMGGGGRGGPGGGGAGGGAGGGGRAGLGFGSLETMKFPVPKISVGLIIGKGGEMIKKIQQETGAKVQFDPVNQQLGDMDEQLAIITGKPDQLRLAQLKIEELVETALHGPPARGGGGGGGGRDSWGGGGGGGGHGNPRRGDQDEERLHVPVGRVGMVIGKGGETIRTINQQSGAHCEIDRNGPQDGAERIFIIRGNRQQIEHAKSLIMEKVNTLPQV
jgi:far upstream element-binding protein